MLCPSCRQTLHEHSSACPHCGFDQPSAARYFGAPVELEHPLTDLAGLLSNSKKRQLREALLGMSQTFPQLRFAAVITKVEARVPLAAHTFWLFNNGGLSAPQESGGLCRLVLLELDVANARAACMIGYGLEPFVPQDALDRITSATLMNLARGDAASAILAALEVARTEFATVSQTIPRAFGLSDAGQTAASGDEAAAFAY